MSRRTPDALRSTRARLREEHDSTTDDDELIEEEEAADEEVPPEPTDTDEPTDDEYLELVRLGAQLVERQDSDRWEYLALAAKVEKRWGEKRLEKWVARTGGVLCTVQRGVSVYRAWEGIQAPEPKLFSVAKALQAHPDRATIITNKPNITKREALDLMRKYRESQKAADDADDEAEDDAENDEEAEDKPKPKPKPKPTPEQQNAKSYLREVGAAAREAIRATKFINEEMAPERLAELRLYTDETLLEELSDAAKALKDCAHWLERNLTEEAAAPTAQAAE